MTGRPGFGGNDQALSIAGVVAIYTGRGRKRKLVGFEIDYRAPIDGSTGYDPSNYVITETVRQRRKLVGRRVGLVTGPGSAANSVRLTLIGKHPFALGGNLVIRSSPPSGIIGANGNYFAGGDKMITILKNVKGIV